MASAALAVTLLGGAAAPVAVLTAPVAAAHSVLLSVDPADGSTVETSPDRVTLTFNEEINPSFVTVVVTGADRTDHVRGEATAEGERVSAGLGELDDGEYTVGYRVTSADGHVVTGSSRFAVGAGAAADRSPTDQATEDQAAADESSEGVNPALWIVGGLTVLLLGAAAFLLLRGGRAD